MAAKRVTRCTRPSYPSAPPRPLPSPANESLKETSFAADKTVREVFLMHRRRHPNPLPPREGEVWLESLVNLGRRLAGAKEAAAPSPAGGVR